MLITSEEVFKSVEYAIVDKCKKIEDKIVFYNDILILREILIPIFEGYTADQKVTLGTQVLWEAPNQAFKTAISQLIREWC